MNDAAESWSYSNLTYTFMLRPGISFSNGRKVEPEDIDYTFDQYRSKKSPFHGSLDSIKKVTATNTDGKIKVVLQLSRYHAPLLTDLSVVKILPREIVEKAGDDFHKNLIGTGSFRVAKQSASEIILEAVDKHLWAAPQTKKVVFKIIKDDNTMFLKTIKGSIDISQATLPDNKVSRVEEDSNLRVYKYPALSMNYMILNLRDESLKNIEVRRAIAMSINREEIIKYKLDGLATPATSIMTPSSPFHNKTLKYPKFDPQAAKKIFEKWQMIGKKIILKTSNNTQTVERGKVIVNQLREAGLNASIQSFEWGTYYKDVKSGNFQIALMRWVGATDPDIYRVAFHSDQLPPGRNRGYYINKKLDKMLEDGLLISDQQKRIEHYNKVQKIVMNDLPTIPLWYKTDVAVVHKRIKDYHPPMNGDFSALISARKVNSTQ